MSQLLDSCFVAVNAEEEVERIKVIPEFLRRFVECWKVHTEIFVNEVLIPIELFIGFKSDFPYSLPSLYFQSLQFGYLPHVESKGGKLCLFEDGVSYKTDNPKDLVVYCIKKAKTLLREGAEKTNWTDFKAEISSYWIRSYNEEPDVNMCYIIYDRIPTSTMALNAINYSAPVRGITNRKTIDNTLLFESDDEPFNGFLSKNFPVRLEKAFFINSFLIPNKAPYEMTFSSFVNMIADVEDRRQVKRYINHNNGGRVFFRLTNNRIGGVFIPPVKLDRKGFRKGSLTASEIYLKFEKKRSFLTRLYGSLYSKERIAERTLGTLMTKQNFAVAGLGSVGSNLVHFLNGYNNASFTLIDNDRLTIDNIGRHLLGFRFVNQFKVDAIAYYLQTIRPEQENMAVVGNIQTYINNNIAELNRHSALFLCTGDTMADLYVIKAINQHLITIPVFFLWLEPYGVAAHMVYINRNEYQPIEIFSSDSLLYKYNAIDDVEYGKPDNCFTKKDAGCNGSYALYSGNDVLEMMSAFYPIICRILSNPTDSKCYRWIGNVKNIVKEGIVCKDEFEGVQKGIIQELPL